MVGRDPPDPRQVADPGVGEDQAGVGKLTRELDRVAPEGGDAAAGEPLAQCGPAIGERERAPHVLLDRVSAFLMLGAIATMRGNEAGAEMLALARLACDVPDEIDDAPLFAVIRGLLDQFDQANTEEPQDRRRLAFLIMASIVARTPDVPIPELATAA